MHEVRLQVDLLRVTAGRLVEGLKMMTTPQGSTPGSPFTGPQTASRLPLSPTTAEPRSVRARHEHQLQHERRHQAVPTLLSPQGSGPQRAVGERERERGLHFECGDGDGDGPFSSSSSTNGNAAATANGYPPSVLVHAKAPARAQVQTGTPILQKAKTADSSPSHANRDEESLLSAVANDPSLFNSPPRSSLQLMQPPTPVPQPRAAFASDGEGLGSASDREDSNGQLCPSPTMAKPHHGGGMAGTERERKTRAPALKVETVAGGAPKDSEQKGAKKSSTWWMIPVMNVFSPPPSSGGEGAPESTRGLLAPQSVPAREGKKDAKSAPSSFSPAKGGREVVKVISGGENGRRVGGDLQKEKERERGQAGGGSPDRERERRVTFTEPSPLLAGNENDPDLDGENDHGGAQRHQIGDPRALAIDLEKHLTGLHSYLNALPPLPLPLAVAKERERGAPGGSSTQLQWAAPDADPSPRENVPRVALQEGPLPHTGNEPTATGAPSSSSQHPRATTSAGIGVAPSPSPPPPLGPLAPLQEGGVPPQRGTPQTERGGVRSVSMSTVGGVGADVGPTGRSPLPPHSGPSPPSAVQPLSLPAAPVPVGTDGFRSALTNSGIGIGGLQQQPHGSLGGGATTTRENATGRHGSLGGLGAGGGLTTCRRATTGLLASGGPSFRGQGMMSPGLMTPALDRRRQSTQNVPQNRKEKEKDSKAKKKKKRTRIIRRLLGAKKGLAVHFGHENWNMVLNMMVGVRLAVGRGLQEANRSVQVFDFLIKEKFSLSPRIGNIFDPSTSQTLKATRFIDYAPFAFRKLRELFQIAPDDYLKSVGPEQLLGNMVLGNLSSLSELSSEGKSGAFFYYTADSKYMLKTVTKSEAKFFRSILKDYFEHVTANRNTLVTRFFGLHALRFKKSGGKRTENSSGGQQKLYFCVMGNMFNTPVEIHRRWDLKGSWVGRDTPMDKREDHTVALKDGDWVKEGNELKISMEKRRMLMAQIERDCDFFRRHGIIDYSLLLGEHHGEKGGTLNVISMQMQMNDRHEMDPEMDLDFDHSVAAGESRRPSEIPMRFASGAQLGHTTGVPFPLGSAVSEAAAPAAGVHGDGEQAVSSSSFPAGGGGDRLFGARDRDRDRMIDERHGEDPDTRVVRVASLFSNLNAAAPSGAPSVSDHPAAPSVPVSAASSAVSRALQPGGPSPALCLVPLKTRRDGWDMPGPEELDEEGSAPPPADERAPANLVPYLPTWLAVGAHGAATDGSPARVGGVSHRTAVLESPLPLRSRSRPYLGREGQGA
uniref:PIPK domain-containing protein n=1 Tax=Chromera velia CCMP2878 TaxID=1169474 RepID=A0A0G4HLZ9_9ALVE|eukprot:Cvel_28946.t1-p1 / transcript=Cvel_28946.t1 / gene=Cvel_28946 / organism=Chromera_velia_CCMP2878 / gene_product=Phosphatidylinositol 4-phosphate 5-kinase its3, putative / transcript_product=Phosphatidylinositol 4-phosphate 5-kinase its3, putative / location=Cvel_scaffold3881:497-13070(+) / protein_length=1281 / sequence_SO=supercontig / SO=protein_coding / is_pseudo=false